MGRSKFKAIKTGGQVTGDQRVGELEAKQSPALDEDHGRCGLAGGGKHSLWIMYTLYKLPAIVPVPIPGITSTAAL